jgi:hypothetical protein
MQRPKTTPPTCILATLKGRYLFGGIAIRLDPDDPDPLLKQQLIAVTGIRTLNLVVSSPAQPGSLGHRSKFATDPLGSCEQVHPGQIVKGI